MKLIDKITTTGAALLLAGGANAATLWTPAEISTAAWFDAADASTITDTAGAVSQWNDKSGNSRDLSLATGATNPTTGTRTLNGLNALDLIETDALQTAAAATWLNGTKYHFFAVLEQDVAGNYAGTDGTVTGGKLLHIGQTNGTIWKQDHFGSGGYSYSHTLDTSALIAVNSFLNTGSEVFINGTSIGSNAGPTSALNTDGPLNIGRAYNGGGLGKDFDGAMGEIIIITGDLTAADQELVEGYLAHKWGTQGTLRADHTYKIDAPTIVAGDPYGDWATGGELFDEDKNGDGVTNGLAFLLGAADPNADATDLLPTVTETAGGLVLNFSMLDSASRGTATLIIEHSGDLGDADPWASVAIPDSSSGPTDGVTFVISGSGMLDVTATIGSSEAVAGKLFGRVRATE